MLRMFVAAVFLVSALQSHAQAPLPQQPLVPSTPANMPAQPAEVTYQNGLLAIRAENSTLADVLTQIQSKTGAQIQVPPGAFTERVVIQERPAPTRVVLDSLLHGSGFDYIIVGSTQDPQSIQRVVLTPHVTTASTTAPPPTAYSARRSQPAPDIQNDDDNTSEQPTMPVPPGPPRPGVQPPQPGQPAQQSQPGQPGQETNPSSGGIKTPEQLLQELQQIQRGQQQPQGQTGQQTAGQPQTPPQMPPRRVPMNPPHD